MKAIKGHENYLIDEAGNIFSKKSNKFLKPYKQKKNGTVQIAITAITHRSIKRQSKKE